jgi:DNA-binding GntR family transcriptional regulator
MDALNTVGTQPILTRERYVAEVLRDAILRGDLKPGEKLDQSGIAKRLRVSRTPVRNALLILSNEGLVEMAPHLGAVVSEISAEEVEEVYFLRGILEGIAARLGAERMTDEHIASLRAVLDAMDASSDPDEWLRLNTRFHYLVYEQASRPRLLALIDSIHDITLPYSRRYIESKEHMRTARAGHERILRACDMRDGKLAQEATQRHLEVVCQGVLGSSGDLTLDR